MVVIYLCLLLTWMYSFSDKGTGYIIFHFYSILHSKCFAVIETLYLCKMKFRIDIIVYSWTCIFACLGYLIIDRFSV